MNENPYIILFRHDELDDNIVFPDATAELRLAKEDARNASGPSLILF